MKSVNPLEKFPEGHPRPYVRDGVADLSREAQLAMLRAAGVPLRQLFEDKLSARAIKRRSYDELKDLAEMLRPTTRTTPETIFVASLRVLGWSVADIARSIAAAGRRHAAIVSLDNGKVIPAGGGPEAFDAFAEIEAQQAKARYSSSLAKAREANRRRRDRKWKRAKLIAEPLWAMTSEEMPVHRIVARLAEAGVPYGRRSLYIRLGNREDAQARARKDEE